MNRFLPEGYKLTTQDGYYIITEITGAGSSTVAYSADYYDVSGQISRRILKEFNPEYIPFYRTENGEFILKETRKKQFENSKEKFIAGCNLQTEIRNKDSMMNQTPVIQSIFPANNTVYSGVAAYNGKTYDKIYKSLDLSDRIKACLSVAKLVKCYHDEGYLCLDIKPENILIFPETKELLQFIDFNSVCKKEEVFSGKILSYTKQWAAPELINFNANDKVSESADIYALGELVFWSVFERHSTTEEHRVFSEYPFDSCTDKFRKITGRNDVQKILIKIFHNTLRASAANRYNFTDNVIADLQSLIEVLSEKEFVISSKPAFQKSIGRDAELMQISTLLESDSTLFVTGIGGIGKSTVVKKYLYRNADLFDIALYLEYDGDIKSTFINQVNINSVNRESSESNEDYFNRKFIRLQAISEKKNVIIVIDNFNGKITKELSRILDCSWKVIVCTRNVPFKCSYNVMNIEAISEPEYLYKIFEANLGYKIKDNEYSFVNDIIKRIDSHTLVLGLIARQIANSHISIEESAKLSEQRGFSDISPEKVELIKDGEEYYDTISGIISGLFDTGNLSDENRVILKIVSLFDITGIDINMLFSLLDLKSKDSFNELEKEGWAYIENSRIKLHPVIAETVSLSEWTDEGINAVNLIMNKLLTYIKAESKKQEFSLKIMDYVNLSEKLLKGIQNVTNISSGNLYAELLYSTVMSMPLYREEYILENAEFLIESNRCRNVTKVLKLFDLIVWIYTEREDFKSAYNEIKKAGRFVFQNKNNHCLALYNEIVATYYDAKLDGGYDAQTEDERKNLAGLIDCIDKSIFCMKRSHSKNKNDYLAEYMISKVNVLMRSMPENKTEIEKLFKEIQKLVIKDTAKISEIRCDYYLSCGWYYTLIRPDLSKVKKCKEKVFGIAERICHNELDLIDKVVIPVANMFLELQCYDDAVSLIRKGIKMCEKHHNIIPYIRKRMNLMKYLLDIYYYSCNYAKCRETILVIEKENIRNCEYGINIEIPEEIYRQTLKIKK